MNEPVGIGPLPRGWCEYCRREIIVWRDGLVCNKWGKFHQRCASIGVKFAIERNHGDPMLGPTDAVPKGEAIDPPGKY